MSQGERIDVALIAGFGESIVSFRGALLKEMRAKGLRVIALAPGLGAGTRRWLTEQGIAFEELPLARAGINPVEDLRYCWQLGQSLRRHRPRLVLAYTVKPVVYGLPVALLSGVGQRYALITGLGYAFTEGRGTWVGQLVRALYKTALATAHAVFFQNPDDRALFEEQGLLPAGTPAHVVRGSGIDVIAFESSSLPSGPPRFLMIARLLGDKGVREYAEAAALLKSRHPEVVCALAGYLDDNPSAIRKEELDRWVASGAIEYLGKLDDVRPALRACTAYVLPSYREGTPRTVLEAMAVGRPIVTTDAPGCRETVAHGENGYLVPIRSVTELEAAMRSLVEQPGLAERMARASRQRAERLYDVRRVNEDMLRGMSL